MLYWQHLSWAILFSSCLFVLKQTHTAHFIPDIGLCINWSQTLYCFSGVTFFRPRSTWAEVSTNIYNGLSLVTGLWHIRNHCQQHLLQQYLALFTLPSMIVLIVILTGSRTIWVIVLWACVCGGGGGYPDGVCWWGGSILIVGGTIPWLQDAGVYWREKASWVSSMPTFLVLIVTVMWSCDQLLQATVALASGPQ